MDLESRYQYREGWNYNNPSNVFTRYVVEREIFSTLGSYDLASAKVLDVGCGYGLSLATLLQCGATATNLYGIDLLETRIEKARQRFPTIKFQVQPATAIPFPDEYFDICTQYTCFSSILSKPDRILAATEMLRVTKSKGLIIWFDAAKSSDNVTFHAINKRELCWLFRDDCHIHIKKLLINPKFTALSLRWGWGLTELLHSLTPFKTHQLAYIRKC